MIAHEKLDAYQCAVAFLEIAMEAVDQVPRGHGDLRTQLRNASTSIPLNIAEGVGKTSPDDERRYFDIARGSATECAAVFDTLHVLGAVDEPDYQEAKELLERIVSMLTKLRD